MAEPRDQWNKCDECGRYIPLNDFANGRATRYLISPDSEFTSEEYETLCKYHSRKAELD